MAHSVLGFHQWTPGYRRSIIGFLLSGLIWTEKPSLFIILTCMNIWGYGCRQKQKIPKDSCVHFICTVSWIQSDLVSNMVIFFLWMALLWPTVNLCLGVIFEQDLFFSAHIKHTCRTAFFHFHIITKVMVKTSFMHLLLLGCTIVNDYQITLKAPWKPPVNPKRCQESTNGGLERPRFSHVSFSSLLPC